MIEYISKADLDRLHAELAAARHEIDRLSGPTSPRTLAEQRIARVSARVLDSARALVTAEEKSDVVAFKESLIGLRNLLKDLDIAEASKA